MRSLHLFAGIGGGILADVILGHEIVGAVEIVEYCRKVLQQHQRDGFLNPFPVFEDVRTFDCEQFKGQTDLICGGFPCQDISAAGRGAGINGNKSRLFYELIRVCGIIRPRFIFLENSPLITSRGFDTVLKEIAKIGYDAEWGTLSAGAVGAPHLRNRWWAVCKRQDVRGGKRDTKSVRSKRDGGKAIAIQIENGSYPTPKARDWNECAVKESRLKRENPDLWVSVQAQERLPEPPSETTRYDGVTCLATAIENGKYATPTADCASYHPVTVAQLARPQQRLDIQVQIMEQLPSPCVEEPSVKRIADYLEQGSYPTPKAHNASERTISPTLLKYHEQDLNTVVQFTERLPTPMVRDAKKTYQAELLRKSPSLVSIIEMLSPAGGKLNPAFVEWLMNFPAGWTRLED